MHETVTREQLVRRLYTRPDSIYVMLVGVHGSGKTTIADALHERGFKRLSMDRMVTKHPILGLHWRALEAKFQEKLRRRLALKNNIVDDNLNSKPSERLAVLEQARVAGYERVAIVFVDTPLAVSLRRNLARPDRAPDFVVEQLWAKLHTSCKPTTAEAELITLEPDAEEMHYAMRVEPFAPTARAEPTCRLVRIVKAMFRRRST